MSSEGSRRVEGERRVNRPKQASLTPSHSRTVPLPVLTRRVAESPRGGRVHLEEAERQTEGQEREQKKAHCEFFAEGLLVA